MSLQTWREEFYPREACDVPAEEALAHSIRKWEGLQIYNLQNHALGVFRDGDIKDEEGSIQIIGSTDCALCCSYKDSFLGANGVRCIKRVKNTSVTSGVLMRQSLRGTHGLKGGTRGRC